MAFCGKCGTKFEDGTKFCPACGTPATGIPQQGAPIYTPPVVPGAPVPSDIRDAQDNKAMAVLAYIIFLIPLLAAKESRFARYHTNEGLVLFLASLVLSIVYTVLTTVLTAISWRLGLAVGGILWLIFFVPTILAVIGIINACKGEMKPLPLIGGIVILK